MLVFCKKIISVLLVLMTSFHILAAAEYPTSEVDMAMMSVSENYLKEKVEFLSDSLCAGRATGTNGGVEASFWLIREFTSLNLLPFNGSYSKSFATSADRVGHNVIGLLPSSVESSAKKYILITAYFDGLGVIGGKLYPGADSNASGVAAMLGIGQMFKSLRSFGRVLGHNIIFAALDAKHSGSGGAAELWRLLESNSLVNPITGKEISPKDVEIMVNLEQIGAVDSPLQKGREDYLIMLGSHQKQLLEVNMKEEFGLDLSFSYYGSKDFTDMFYRRLGDQKIFVNNGKKAVMFTSGLTMNNNKPWDTPQTIDYIIMKKRVWLIFQWISRII